MVSPYAYPGLVNQISLLKAVCDAFNVKEEDLLGECKWRDVAYARHVYFYVSTKSGMKTHEKAGRDLNRDYSTSIYGTRKIEGILPIYKDLRVKVDELMGLVSSVKIGQNNNKEKQVNSHA